MIDFGLVDDFIMKDERVNSKVIDFLKNKGIKVYNEIIEIAEQPGLLFSNDKGQYNAEATYNLYTIQKLNKLIKNNSISISELEKVFLLIEASWSSYLNNHFKGKTFVFYLWGDYQIPAIRISVVSFHRGLELPFACIFNKANDLNELLIQYKEHVLFDGVSNNTIGEIQDHYALTVYSKYIKC